MVRYPLLKKGGKGVKKGASMISLNSGEKNFLPKKPTTKFSKRKVIKNFSNFWQKSTLILDLAHQPDEWIGVDDMIDSAKIMGKALTNFHSVT